MNLLRLAGLSVAYPCLLNAAKARIYDLQSGKVSVLQFKNRRLMGHGPIRGTLTNGVKVEGEFTTVPRSESSWGIIYGGGASSAGISTMISNEQRGTAVVSGEGVLIECEYRKRPDWRRRVIVKASLRIGIGSCSDVPELSKSTHFRKVGRSGAFFNFDSHRDGRGYSDTLAARRKTARRLHLNFLVLSRPRTFLCSVGQHRLWLACARQARKLGRRTPRAISRRYSVRMLMRLVWYKDRYEIPIVPPGHRTPYH